jgi:hypothetical protein
MGFEYKLTVKDDGSATLKKVSGELDKLSKKFNETDESTKKLGKTITTSTTLGNLWAKGITLAAGEIGKLGKEIVDSYDSAAKLSRNIGVASDSVIGLRHAAKLANVGSEAMDNNMVKLSKTIAEAASGSKSASAAFGKMGISVKNADGSVKNSEKVLMEMADAFKNIPAGAQKATLAMDVFGKSGSSMVEMLKDGSGALKEMVEEGKASAGNVDGVAEAMEKLNDSGTRAKAVVVGLIASFMDVGPIKSFIDLTDELGKKLLKNLGESKYAVEQKKEIARMEADGEKATMRILKFKEAQMLYSENADKKQLQAVRNQIAATQKKLNLGQDEINLITAKARANALGKKENLSDDEQAKLDKYKKQIELIEGKAAAEAKAAAAKKKADDDAAIAAQKAIAGYDEKKDKEKELARIRADALKIYEAEGKKLTDWLETFRNAKKTESEIAEASYRKEIANLDELLKRKKISQTEHSVYSIQAEGDYSAKLKDIDKKYQDEKAQAEEKAQARNWELRKIAAKNSNDLLGIELEQIKARYDKEIKIAAAAKEDTKLLESAKAAEIAGIREQASQKAMSEQEHILSLRRTAAASDDERLMLEKASIEMRYDAELERAQGNAALITEIERAKAAEIAEIEDKMHQMRMDRNMAAMNSSFQVLEAVVTYGKAGGTAMKAIAAAQAGVNTALAATKAATAAPWPLNIPLVAGALAQGALQIRSIAAQKFAGGGMIPGSNTLILANEQGREAILNTRAVRAIGGEMGVNSLNRGTSNSYSYDNSRSSSNTIVINTSIMTQQAYRNEIEPVLKRTERRR